MFEMTGSLTRNATLATRIVQEAMALIGKIEEYDEKESWIKYRERLEQYFAANKITDSGNLINGRQDEWRQH